MQKQQGFTLVELIVVILIMGILAYGSVQFILNTSGAYVDSQQRSRLAAVATSSLERLSQELRLAMPGSLRLNSDGPQSCLEFIPIQIAPTSPPDQYWPSQLSTERYYQREIPTDIDSPYRYPLAEPVSFCLFEQRLYRYQDYGHLLTQPLPTTGLAQAGRQLLADQVDPEKSSWAIIDQGAERQRWVLLTLNFKERDEHLLLQREVRLVYE